MGAWTKQESLTLVLLGLLLAGAVLLAYFWDLTKAWWRGERGRSGGSR